SIELAPDLPHVIHTDRPRLEQILRNLIGNALKFTDAGGVKLRIESVQPPFEVDADASRQADGSIAFVASDGGIGIALNKQKIIFRGFPASPGWHQPQIRRD